MPSDPSLGAVSKSAAATTTLSDSNPRNIPVNYDSHPSTSKIPNRNNADERPRSPDSSGEEQALEWHEVIELQEFSKRKAWIEEKTKFLEKMPPVQVFVGLDAVRASAEEVPGLPTREQLKQWLVEHDKIEKETEVFDSGELRKLKKFTKAAAQRNLSPADTDLIELTLTTIYALDKLLHLLRDRSDNLELLGVRLTWEERRIGSWVELRSIVTDLKAFLDTRAQWSPSVYDRVNDDEDSTPASEASIPSLPSLRRKGSMSSLMSTASDSTISSLAMSRGERFRLAETLSRDAAQFASRVSSLRHAKITAAGKALDKLIDDSRKPVPDELLDEQDKLEDKGIKEMEDVGKFVMGVVMQWKKADEIFVETAKDQSTAQTLLEEIEMAKLNHPTARRDNAFLSRSTALAKRLKMRENPSSPISYFPRPTHHLFPEQEKANTDIANILSAELAVAHEQAAEAERAAKDYHATLEKVKKIESLSKVASDLTGQLESIAHRLETGVETTAGDGSPLSLASEACLHSKSHSVFLAHCPELFDSVGQLEQAANEAIMAGRAALAVLPRSGIDPQFIQDSADIFDRLASYRTSAINIRSSVAFRIDILRKCRDVWSSMADSFDGLDNLRYDVVEVVRRQMYKSHTSQDAALLTPESPSSSLSLPDLTLQQANEQVEALALALNEQVVSPLSSVATSVGPALAAYLSDCSSGLSQSMDSLRRLTRSWKLVQEQASEMALISDEAHAFQMRSEHLKLQYESSTRYVLDGELSGDELRQKEDELETSVLALTTEVQMFQDKLSHRLPFVSSEDRGVMPVSTLTVHRRRFSISTGFSLDVVRQAAQAGLPFDSAALDRAARTDVNSYSIMLAGEVETLSRQSKQFRLVQQARAIDVSVSAVSRSLQDACASLNAMQSLLDSHTCPVSLDNLHLISTQVDQLYREKGQSLAASCISARDLLERLEADHTSRDSSYESTILAPRRRAVEEAEESFNGWRENVEVLSEQLSDMQHAERVRLEQEAEAKAVAEEAERLRQAAEAARLQREKAEEEARAQAEAERLRAKAEADARAQQELLLAEERARVLAEEQRQQAAAAARDKLNASQAPVVQESQLVDRMARVRPGHQADVFGIARSDSMDSTKSEKDTGLQNHIVSLRKRLRSLNINEIARPSRDTASSLPTQDLVSRLVQQLEGLRAEAKTLPDNISTAPYVDAELRSLRSELDASSEMLTKIRTLAEFSSEAQQCDDLLSDLLEHIDSYPGPPLGTLSSVHVTDTSHPPEDQMSSRLTSTNTLIRQLVSKAESTPLDSRVAAERDRITQTWEELEAMGIDRINGQKSRPPSVMSSGRISRASASPSPVPGPSRKDEPKTRSTSYSSLSAAPSGSKYLAPPPATRRTTSTGSHSRSSSRASTNRVASGSTATTQVVANSRLYTTTFASRQRSSSINATIATVIEPPKPATPPVPSGSRATGNRPRARTGQSSHGRVVSPLVADMPRSQSRSSQHLSRSTASANRSTWSRAPRQSFPNIPMSPPPRKTTSKEKKPYVPNPKNKLDVAVGDVVNNLPVNINIEVVAETWKDQSGKYWIGDEDAKLCFCRILRSQTVMVRVGGGWTELSKFIKEHFADSFRVLPLPESPPLKGGSHEEKWISSTTLAQALSDKAQSPPLPPQTPEPQLPFIPTFALSTPTGTSPRSIKSSSPGSPLHPMQFIRRAERESLPSRPETPTKVPRSSSALSFSHSSRQLVWRP